MKHSDALDLTVGGAAELGERHRSHGLALFLCGMALGGLLGASLVPGGPPAARPAPPPPGAASVEPQPVSPFEPPAQEDPLCEIAHP